MSARLGRFAAVLGLGALVASTGPLACLPKPDRADGYGTRAPRVTPTVDKVPVTGYRARIKFADRSVLVGELLAAEPDGQIVIRTKAEGDQSRPFADIVRAQVQVDRRAAARLGGLGAAAGVLAPLSFTGGLLVVYTIPVVMVAGSVSLGVAWAESRVILKAGDLRYLFQYARWPQGMPQQGAVDPQQGETPVGRPLTGTEAPAMKGSAAEPGVVEPGVVEPVIVEPAAETVDAADPDVASPDEPGVL